MGVSQRLAITYLETQKRGKKPYDHVLGLAAQVIPQKVEQSCSGRSMKPKRTCSTHTG